MEHQLHRGHRFRLLGVRPEAELADRLRLLQAHGGRRLRGRRPGHRCRGLRHLRRQRLGGLRRHQRLLADHRRRLRPRGHPGLQRLPGEVPLQPHWQPERRHQRLQRLLQHVVLLQGDHRLRRPDRLGHPERHRGLHLGRRHRRQHGLRDQPGQPVHHHRQLRQPPDQGFRQRGRGPDLQRLRPAHRPVDQQLHRCDLRHRVHRGHLPGHRHRDRLHRRDRLHLLHLDRGHRRWQRLHLDPAAGQPGLRVRQHRLDREQRRDHHRQR
ncbi:hypothetical protein SGPA1_30111 [Streptomyces misionensis JCM 4497]